MSQSPCTTAHQGHLALIPSKVATGLGLRSRCCGHAYARPDGHERRWGAETKSRSSFGQPGHLFTKHEASQLVSQLLDLFRVASGAEAFRQLEECFLFLLLGFDSLLNEFHQHAIVAESALPGQGLNLSRDLGGQGYTSPDVLCAH